MIRFAGKGAAVARRSFEEAGRFIGGAVVGVTFEIFASICGYQMERHKTHPFINMNVACGFY